MMKRTKKSLKFQGQDCVKVLVGKVWHDGKVVARGHTKKESDSLLQAAEENMAHDHPIGEGPD